MPGTVASTAKHSSQGSRTATGRKRAKHAQPLTARPPWYGEGNSKTVQPPPKTAWTGKRSAEAHECRRRQQRGGLANVSPVRDQRKANLEQRNPRKRICPNQSHLTSCAPARSAERRFGGSTMTSSSGPPASVGSRAQASANVVTLAVEIPAPKVAATVLPPRAPQSRSQIICLSVARRCRSARQIATAVKRSTLSNALGKDTLALWRRFRSAQG